MTEFGRLAHANKVQAQEIKELRGEIQRLVFSRDNALKNMEQWKHEANALRSLLKALMEETERSGDDQSRAYYDAERAIKGST